MLSFRRWIALAALVSVLGGCGLSKEPAPQPIELGGQTHWQMPLDDNSLRLNDTLRFEYAASLLNDECLSRSGFEVQDPWLDTEAFVPRENVNDLGRLLFTPESASKWGYHKAPQRSDLSQFEAFGFVVSQMSEDTPGFEEAFLNCVEESYDTLGEEWVSAGNYAMGLASIASAVALEDPTVVEAAKLWRECMRQVGAGVLPSSPFEMPTQSMTESWQPDAEGLASAAEISVAVGDAQCRESSGFTDALYITEWQAQLNQIDENRDALDSGRQTLQEWRTQVDAIIGSHVRANE